MPTISVMSGNVILRNGSAATRVFHCPRRGGAGGDRECMLFAAAKGARTGSAVQKLSGWASDVPGVSGCEFQEGGRVSYTTYEIAEGEIIKLATNRRAPLEEGREAPMLTANRFYRVRASAGVMCIKTKWFDDSRCPNTHGSITGPLEALTLRQALAMGVHIPEEYQKESLYGDGVCRHLLTETVIQAAETVVNEVVTPEGEIIVAARNARPRRRIRTT